MRREQSGSGIGLGIAIGVALGAALDKMAMGIAPGVDARFDVARKRRQESQDRGRHS